MRAQPRLSRSQLRRRLKRLTVLSLDLSSNRNVTLLRTGEEMFWSRCNPYGKKLGCWIWKRSLSYGRDGGYGIFHFTVGEDRYRVLAHRAAWALENGPIPKGHEIIHTRCESRVCVRPDHLKAASDALVVANRVKKGRSAIGERHGRHKLKKKDIPEIRRRFRLREPVSGIAADYEVSPRAIRYIGDGVNWAHVR